MAEKLASLRKKGGGGSEKFAHAAVTANTNTTVNMAMAITNDSTVFSVPATSQNNTATITILKAGKYRYSITNNSRGSGGGGSVVIGGVNVYTGTGDIGEITLNANDTCVMTATSGAYFYNVSVVLMKL